MTFCFYVKKMEVARELNRKLHKLGLNTHFEGAINLAKKKSAYRVRIYMQTPTPEQMKQAQEIYDALPDEEKTISPWEDDND